MTLNSLQFLGGIVVGVLVNLLSWPIQRRLDRVSARRAQQQEEREQEFRRQVDRFAADRSALNSELLTAVLKLASVVALFGLVSGLLFALPDVLTFREADGDEDLDFARLNEFRNVVYVVAQLLGLVSFTIVYRISRKAIVLATAVRARQPPSAPKEHE